MFVSSLQPKVDYWVRFSDFDRRKIMRKSGCYALAAFDGTILYIGQSINIHERIGVHLNDDAKKKETPDGVVRWVYYLFCQENLLDKVECKWTEQHIAEEGDLPFLSERMPPA